MTSTLRRLLAVCVGLFILAAPTPMAMALPAGDVALEPQYADVAGTRIAWAAIGAGDPLLLLNGTASPMNEWDPAFLGALASSRRVIVLDYPGLGLSGAAPGRWTFDHASDWISAFITAIHPEGPVDVLGWSMGGFIAQRLAVRHPGQVDHLVLAATNPGGDAAVLGPRWVQEADSSGDDAAYLDTNYPPRRRAAGERFLRRLDAALASGRYPGEFVPRATRRAMVAAEDPWLRSNVNLRELRRTAVPALVVTGADDVITPAVNSRRLSRALPNAILRLVPHAGHSFLFQQPRAVARMIDGFLGPSASAAR